jgi:hypothetical protein
MKLHDQSFCQKCGRMYCEGYWGEGVCVTDMHFCGEPTADGDETARCLRLWYEARRETAWERSKINPRGRAWEYAADNLMLGLIIEIHRISCEQDAQLKRRSN